MTADQLAAYLGVVKTTMANKAALINKALTIGMFEPDLTSSAILEQHPLAWLVKVDGLILDARTLAPELQDEARWRGLIPDLDQHRRMTTTKQLRELDALIDDLTIDAYNDEEQLAGFLVGADEALQRGEPARIAGIEVEVIKVDTGSGARTGLTARVQRDGLAHGVALADLPFPADSRLGRIVAAYRRWQGRTP